MLVDLRAASEVLLLFGVTEAGGRRSPSCHLPSHQAERLNGSIRWPSFPVLPYLRLGLHADSHALSTKETGIDTPRL